MSGTRSRVQSIYYSGACPPQLPILTSGVGIPCETRLAAPAHLCLAPPTASEADTLGPFATPVKVGKGLRWTCPDQLPLPHTGDLDPMPPQPPPWASSPQVGSHSPARCVLQKHGACFSSQTELSSQEPLLGQTQPPWNILPGAKTGPAGGKEQPPGAEVGFCLGFPGVETHRAFELWLTVVVPGERGDQ